MKFNKKDMLILVVPFVILAIIYPFLPPQIPRQFRFNGEPPAMMAKEFIFLFGFIPFLIFKHYKSKNK